MRTWGAVGCLVGSWLSAVAIAWAGSHPGGNLTAGLVAACLTVVTAGCWLVLVIVAVVRRSVLPVAVLTVVALVLVAGSLLATRIELPLLARFTLSQSAFERTIGERGEVGPDAVCPRVIGTYRILSCRTVGSDTYFTERDGGFLDRVGFVYLPEGVPTDPPTSTSITYGQLRGPWYWFEESW